ncbi:Uncharacterised protein [Mycobacteroides abscessus subsp. abscessus]|nr:Uncharacterised protein [Mycobacteroides abscessus subsp. abscessus]
MLLSSKGKPVKRISAPQKTPSSLAKNTISPCSSSPNINSLLTSRSPMSSRKNCSSSSRSFNLFIFPILFFLIFLLDYLYSQPFLVILKWKVASEMPSSAFGPF